MQLLLWNRQCWRLRQGLDFPSFWVLPRPQQTWCDIHYFDRTIPGDYFRRWLPLKQKYVLGAIEYFLLRNLLPQKQLLWPIAVLRFSWVHHLIRMDVPKTGKIVPKSWIYDCPWMIWRSQRNVVCEAEKRNLKGSLNGLNWLAGFSQEKNILFVVRKKSCLEAGWRHLWRFVSVDKFLSALSQVGHTWRGQLITAIWRTFIIETNVSKFFPKCDLCLSACHTVYIVVPGLEI